MEYNTWIIHWITIIYTYISMYSIICVFKDLLLMHSTILLMNLILIDHFYTKFSKLFCKISDIEI